MVPGLGQSTMEIPNPMSESIFSTPLARYWGVAPKNRGIDPNRFSISGILTPDSDSAPSIVLSQHLSNFSYHVALSRYGAINFPIPSLSNIGLLHTEIDYYAVIYP